MKKKSLVLAGMLLIGSSAFAQEKDWFVGMEVGHTEVGATTTYSGYTTGSKSSDQDGAHQSIKVGKYFGENIRAGLVLTRYNTETDVSVNSQAIAVDYLFGNEAFKPLIGASISKFKYEQSNLCTGYSKQTLELSDTAFGVHFGGLYEIAKNWDFEAGYRIIKNSASDNVTYTPTNPDLKTNVDSSDVKAWYLGFNYNF